LAGASSSSTCVRSAAVELRHGALRSGPLVVVGDPLDVELIRR
jgi:hypothetical protein